MSVASALLVKLLPLDIFSLAYCISIIFINGLYLSLTNQNYLFFKLQ